MRSNTRSRGDLDKILADGIHMSWRQFQLLLVALMSVMLLSALDHTIVVTALPIITDDLGGEYALAWVVTAYMLASALAALWFGQLVDVFGVRPCLITGVLIFTVASALCGLAQDMTQLVILRAFQGIGAGAIMTLCKTVIALLVRPRERGRYQSYIMTVFAGASLAGPIVGGSIADHLSWRIIFLVNLPVGLLALYMIRRSLQHIPAHARGRDSTTSAILLSIAAFAFLFSVSQYGEAGIDLRIPTVTLVISLLLVAAFLAWERRTPRPIFRSPILRSRLFITANMAAVLHSLSMMGAVILLPLYFQRIRGHGAAETGMMMLPQVGGWLIATLLCGLLMSWTGRVKAWCVLGMSLTMVGLAGLSTLDSATAYGFTAVYLVVFGVGQGLASQSLIVAIQARAESHEMGKATGFTAFARQVGSLLGVALSGVCLNILIASGRDLTTAFSFTMAAAVPVSAIGILVAVMMPRLRLGHERDARTGATNDAADSTDVPPHTLGTEQSPHGYEAAQVNDVTSRT